MTLENPQDGNPKPTGVVEQPTSQPSSAGGQLSQDAIEALINKRFKEAEKSLQKGFDKRLGQTNPEIDRILELQGQGLTKEQIKRELWIDQQMGRETVSSPELRGSVSGGAGFDADVILQAFQFPENDVALNALKIAYKDNPTKLVEEAAKLRKSQMAVPSPTPASSPISQNIGSEPKATREQLQAEYEKRRNEILSTTKGDERIKRLSALKGEFGEKGLATY